MLGIGAGIAVAIIGQALRANWGGEPADGAASSPDSPHDRDSA